MNNYRMIEVNNNYWLFVHFFLLFFNYSLKNLTSETRETMKKTLVVFLAVIITASIIAPAVFADSFKPYPTPLKGKKIAILLDSQYQVGEAFYAIPRFKEAGAEVKVVSHDVPVAHRFRPNFIQRKE